jgi:hypothetical protein
LMVDSRWATTRTVRSARRTSRASCMRASVSESMLAVASSRRRMAGILEEHPGEGEELSLTGAEVAGAFF